MMELSADLVAYSYEQGKRVLEKRETNMLDRNDWRHIKCST